MDLSKFSDADLKALQANNLAGLSDEGLKMLSSTTPAAAPAAPKEDLTKAAFGVRPRGIRQRTAEDVTKQDFLAEQFGKNRPAEFSGIPAYLAAGAESAAVAAPVGATIGAVLGGGVPGAAAGGATAVPLGFFSGLASQAMKDLGFGPGTQMLAGMAPMPGGQAVSQAITKTVAPATERVGAALYSALPYKVRAGLSALTGKPEVVMPPTARDVLTGGAAPSRAAETAVGEAAQRGAAVQTEAARAQAAQQKAAIEAKYQADLQAQRERVAALRGEVSKAKAAQQQAAGQAAAEVSGITTVPPSELGAEIQGRLIGQKAALDTEIKNTYREKLKDFLDFARGEQRAGRFWQDSEAGKSAITRIEDLLKPTAEMGEVRALKADQETAVRKVLDDIQGNRKVTVTEPYPETKVVPQPVDVMVIDDVIRELGEAAKGRPSEGYAAIGENLAKEMRSILRGSMEDYAGAYGAAKQSYREGSKLLETFKEGQVAKVTQTTNTIRDRLRTDPVGVGDTLFKSPQTISDLTEALGGDKKLVADFARQYVNNKLAEFGGDVRKTANWLNKPRTQEMMEAAGIKGHGQDYLKNLQDFTSKAEGAGKGVAVGEAKLAPEKLRQRDVVIGEAKTRALENVRAQATAYEKRISDVINSGKFEVDTLERVLNSPTKKNIQTIGQLMDDQGRAAMPDAIRQYMSRSSPTNLGNTWDKLKPMLEYGKLLDSKQIAALDADVKKAVEQMGKTPTKKQINQLGVLISGRVAGALGGMAVSE